MRRTPCGCISIFVSAIAVTVVNNLDGVLLELDAKTGFRVCGPPRVDRVSENRMIV